MRVARFRGKGVHGSTARKHCTKALHGSTARKYDVQQLGWAILTRGVAMLLQSRASIAVLWWSVAVPGGQCPIGYLFYDRCCEGLQVFRSRSLET